MRHLSKGQEDLSTRNSSSLREMAFDNFVSQKAKQSQGLAKPSSLKNLTTSASNFKGPQVSIKPHKTVGNIQWHLVVIAIDPPTFYRHLNCSATKACRQARLSILVKSHTVT